MKRLFFAVSLILLSAACYAQSKPKPQLPDYSFTTVKANPITSVKNQHRSGTCWAFSGTAFFESEAIRINDIKDTLKYPDFSVFFTVSHSYMDRAVKYVRLDGALGFSAGSSCGDVREVIRDYGIVPLGEMTGMQYGTALPEQSELDAVLLGYVKNVNNGRHTLTTAWQKGFASILESYLGAYPETFTVDGVPYTPQSYRDALGINPDNYIGLSSFTHHPFYKPFVIEVCDNWRWEESYNLPIDELMEALDAALNAGYTVAWGADVSCPGFTRDGLAVLLDEQKSTTGSDQEHWVGKEEGKPAPIVTVVEKVPTQESRQIEYDNKTMTDDHGMLIFGIAKDQNGNKFYMVKNSWGETGKYKGIWYASENFVKGQTLDLLLHKDALPKDIRKKLGLK